MMRYRLAQLVALVALAALPALAAAQSRPGGTPSTTPTPPPPGVGPGTPAPPPPGRPGAAAPAAPTDGGAASPVTAVPSGLPLSSEYVIGPGDVLQISVWKNESLSRVVPVRPDGKISMPLLHDIQAAGLTAMQLRDKIARALAEFLPNPEVAVSVTEVRSMRVSVLGEVMRPGVLELRGTTTILEAIAMAGGFRDFASPSKIMVIRTDANGRTEKIRFNYNRAVGGDEHNLVLKPGDVVVVP
jgi:polysaccharide export outer membrane protein